MSVGGVTRANISVFFWATARYKPWKVSGWMGSATWSGDTPRCNDHSLFRKLWANAPAYNLNIRDENSCGEVTLNVFPSINISTSSLSLTTTHNSESRDPRMLRSLMLALPTIAVRSSTIITCTTHEFWWNEGNLPSSAHILPQCMLCLYGTANSSSNKMTHIPQYLCQGTQPKEM